MQPFSYLVKEAVPNYLAGLPIPSSVGGWFRLGFKDWLSLIPPTALLVGSAFVVHRAIAPRQINPIIRKDCRKVVETVEIEDIAEKTFYCRCWLSKKWPLCDGAHGPHNRATGDNVGPLIVTTRKLAAEAAAKK